MTNRLLAWISLLLLALGVVACNGGKQAAIEGHL